MTISSEVRKTSPFVGDGVITTLPFVFKVFTTADVLVVRADSLGVETELDLGTHYTVDLNADQNTSPGGDVMLLSALATGTTAVVGSKLQELQPVDLTNQGGFYPAVINSALDRATIQIQQLSEKVDRSAKLPITSTADADSLSADLVLVADHVTEIDTVAGISGNVTTVAGVAANVTTVAGVAANVTTVAGVSANVTTVAGIAANVTTVAGVAAGVTTVAGISANVTTVAGIAANVTTVAGIAANVTTVATNVADVTNFADVYQGPKAADPTLRNDGSALQNGDMYFSTSLGMMRVYDASLAVWKGASADAGFVAYTPAGTGAVATTVEAKLRQHVNVEDFGATTSGDASAAFLAACTAVAATGGGVVYFKKNYSILTNLSVPDNVALVGEQMAPGQIQDGGTGGDYDALGSVLKIASTATITLGSSASLSNCVLVRSGLDLPFASLVAAQAGVPGFAGTAVTIGGDDAKVENVLILGFTTAITSASRGRMRFFNVQADCTNGIDVSAALDVVYMDQCHLWPFTTANYSWTASDTTQLILTRSGVAFNFHDTVDWPKITNCFSYGYFRGFRLHNTNSAEVVGCSADGPVSGGAPVQANSIGFLVEGTAVDNKITSCYAAGKAQGYNLNGTSGNVEIASSDAVACTIGCYKINVQELAWFGGLLRNCNYGFQISAAGTCHIHDPKIRDYLTKPFNVTVSTSELSLFGCNYIAPGGGAAMADNAANWLMPTIASADPLNLSGNKGDKFLISGTTNFGSLNGGYPGRTVSLFFAGALTVINGGSMRLNGGANFVVAAGSSLTLTWDGTQWREVGRCP